MAKLPTLRELKGLAEEDDEEETVSAMERKFYLMVLDEENDEWETVTDKTSYGKCLTEAKDYYESPWVIAVEMESAPDGLQIVALQPDGFLPLGAMDEILDRDWEKDLVPDEEAADTGAKPKKK